MGEMGSEELVESVTMLSDVELTLVMGMPAAGGEVICDSRGETVDVVSSVATAELTFRLTLLALSCWRLSANCDVTVM